MSIPARNPATQPAISRAVSRGPSGAIGRSVHEPAMTSASDTALVSSSAGTGLPPANPSSSSQPAAAAASSMSSA
jgi:hypothetical protein